MHLNPRQKKEVCQKSAPFFFANCNIRRVAARGDLRRRRYRRWKRVQKTEGLSRHSGEVRNREAATPSASARLATQLAPQLAASALQQAERLTPQVALLREAKRSTRQQTLSSSIRENCHFTMRTVANARSAGSFPPHRPTHPTPSQEAS